MKSFYLTKAGHEVSWSDDKKLIFEKQYISGGKVGFCPRRPVRGRVARGRLEVVIFKESMKS